MSSLFEKLFPLPALLRMPAVGLDISDYSIKYVEIAPSTSAIRIKRFGIEIIPEGIVEAGNIVDQKKLDAIIERIAKRIRTKFLRVALPDDQGFMFQIEIPRVEPDEVEQAIAFQIEEHVPAKSEDLSFDFEYLDSNENTFDLHVTAALKKNIVPYRDALRRNELAPLSFEINSQATARALTFGGKQEQNFLLLDLGEASTSISLIRQNRVMVTATIPKGGRTLTEEIMKKQSVDFEEAEKIKQESGLYDGQASAILLSAMKKIAKDILKYRDYWVKNTSFFDMYQNDSLRIVGGGGNMQGLDDFFSEELQMQSFYGLTSLPLKTSSSSKNFPKQFTSYATALGLALGALDYD